MWLPLFSFIQPIWVPNKQSKVVLLKNSFSRRYSWKTWFCAVSHWAEIEMFENPNHTALSRTPRSVILRGAESNNFFFLSKTSITMTFRIYEYVMIFRKKFENILKIQKWLTLRRVRLHAMWYCAKSDSAQYNTVWSQGLPQIQKCLTLRGVLPGTILSLQASPCLHWEYYIFFKLYVYYCNIAQHFL